MPLSPHELHLQASGDHVDIPRLMSVAIPANKYGFSSLEEWCLAILEQHLEESHEHFDACTAAQLEKYLLVAIRGDRSGMRDWIADYWITGIRQGDDENFPPRRALEFGEKYGLREFQGSIYEIELYRFRELETLPGSTAVTFAPEDLSPLQVHRLLVGFHSLTTYWHRLMAAPPPFPRPDGCDADNHEQECVSHWNAAWASLRKPANYLDILGGPINQLESLESTYEHLCQLSRSMRWGCRGYGCNLIRAVRAELLRTLPDHFLGPQQNEGTLLLLFAHAIY